MRAAWGLALGVLLSLMPSGAPLLAQTDAPPTVPEGSVVEPADAPPTVAPDAQAQFPIVLLDQERLLAGSLYGQRIQRELEAARSALATENRQIEAQLTEEELSLTERRAALSPEAFRPLAQDFNSRVEGIRMAQEAKSRTLQEQAEAAQVAFFEAAFPVLIEILRLRGAAVLMDARAVLLGAEDVDITTEAIARIDLLLGDGGPDPLIRLDAATPASTP